MIKHIVMWRLQGNSASERALNAMRVRAAFQSLQGKIPGMLELELGVDVSQVDYACDVVLYSVFDTQASLEQYAVHPEHLRVRRELEGVRIARHQVDYLV